MVACMCNLFGLVSTDPGGLYDHPNPVGDLNDSAIVDTARNAGVVVCAWGNHGIYKDRRDAILTQLREQSIPLSYLKMNGTQEPAHPLYLARSLKPQPWD